MSDLTLLGRKSLSLTGVKKVKSSEVSQVVAILADCTIVISGSNLAVENVSISQGTLDVTGMVTGIKYVQTVARKVSFKNIFK